MAARSPQHRWTSAGKVPLPPGFGAASARVAFVMQDFSAPASRPPEQEGEGEGPAVGHLDGAPLGDDAAHSQHDTLDDAAHIEDGGEGGGLRDAGGDDMEDDTDLDQLPLDDGMGGGMLPFDDAPAPLGSPVRMQRSPPPRAQLSCPELLLSSMHACSDEANSSAFGHDRACSTDHFPDF